MSSHGAYNQMSFCLGTPKLEVPKLKLLWLWGLTTFCVNLRLKLGLKKSCSPHLELSNIMWHATCTQVNQGDSQLLVVENQIRSLTPDLLLAITCVLSTQMGHTSPFYASTSQEISNFIRNFSIQWVLTLEITLWKFRSPLGLQLPKGEPTWECVSSFPHTFVHPQEHEMWFSSFTFRPHICKPLLWSQAQG
jgi:hypothetical protein